MIQLKNISFSYPEKEVLKDFSFTLGKTERIALMGPSGCGKTTLLRLIMGLETAQSGEVQGLPHPVAAVFQEDRLLAHLSALENTALAGEDPQKAARILTALGLGEELQSKPDALSGGMRRRVAIARALCTDSSLLILDEAFNGLDEETKKHTAKVILDEWQSAILAVTHLPEEAALLGAKIHPM
ncbi:MAG: ABC transporter ATP-binding protein [Clostridia bacterium]|nr:ABC transporter ATP-binding protein [Clostridia bacterium]